MYLFHIKILVDSKWNPRRLCRRRARSNSSSIAASAYSVAYSKFKLFSKQRRIPLSATARANIWCNRLYKTIYLVVLIAIIFVLINVNLIINIIINFLNQILKILKYIWYSWYLEYSPQGIYDQIKGKWSEFATKLFIAYTFHTAKWSCMSVFHYAWSKVNICGRISKLQRNIDGLSYRIVAH